MKELLDELGGIAQFIKSGEKFLIKLNMLEGVEKGYSVTTPSVVY